MSAVSLTLEDDLVALLHGLNLSTKQAVRELVTLELYRRGTISSGKAAELLEMSRWEFVRRAAPRRTSGDQVIKMSWPRGIEWCTLTGRSAWLEPTAGRCGGRERCAPA